LLVGDLDRRRQDAPADVARAVRLARCRREHAVVGATARQPLKLGVEYGQDVDLTDSGVGFRRADGDPVGGQVQIKGLRARVELLEHVQDTPS
jgi:hypothetical protein